MTTSLFEEDEVKTRPVVRRPTSMRERLIAAYAAELLAHPPVRSLDPAHEPDEARRQGEARRLAGKDIERLLRAIVAAELEISDRGKLAFMKLLLGEWRKSFHAEEQAGGAPSEVDWDDLERRTGEALGENQ